MGLSLTGIGGVSGILPPPSGGGFDSDAQAFITATGITDSTQQNAINNLVLGFKANGTWDKYVAIYPLVGGTAFRHSLNLKDPRDLSAANRLIYTAGVIHSSAGMRGNGATAWADTGYLSAPSGMAFYTNTSNSAGDVAMGTDGSQNGFNRVLFHPRFNDGNTYLDAGDAFSRRRSTAFGGTIGYTAFSMDWISGNGSYLANRSIIFSGNTGVTGSPNLAGQSITLLNAAGQQGPTQRLYQFFSLLQTSITSAQMLADMEIVNTYQTTLGRAV